MRPSQVIEALKKAVENPAVHPPVFLWGPPGAGKSSVVRQVAKTTNRALVDLRAALLDPTDIRGIPIPKDGQAVWLPPSFLPPTDSTGKWILFLDELNLAAPLVQHACYQLVLDRRAGEYVLPTNCFIIAAGNRQEDRAGTRDMPAPLANRFLHVDFEVNIEDWTTWALANDISPEVIAFLQLNADLLFSFDPAKDKRAFPTPRSIEFVDQVWRMHRDMEAYVWPLMEGCVGKEWVSKFHTFLRIQAELPNIETILAGKSSVVPTRSDLRYAVAALIGTKAQVQHLEAAMRYASKLPVEQGVLLAQLLARRKELGAPLANTPAWVEWIKANREFVIPS